MARHLGGNYSPFIRRRRRLAAFRPGRARTPAHGRKRTGGVDAAVPVSLVYRGPRTATMP